MKILVRRTGALGDVVMATPVVRRLRRENSYARIFVQTAYPDVFKDNPHVDMVLPDEGGERVPINRLVDLDLAYERRPDMHVVEAYMLEAFGDTGERSDRRQELFFDRSSMSGIAGKGYVAVHAAVAGWRNRTLPRDTWKEVLHRLNVAGLSVILIGTERDAIPGYLSFLVPDIHAQASLIQSCVCFVGSDSGLLHVAGATDTPIVGVFTSARPEYRLPFREDCAAVVPPGLDCLGCLARQPVPSTTESCERGDLACVGAVRATDIVDAVLKLIL